MYSIKSILVTGANRGIGLGFVKELVINPMTTVIATTRNLENSVELKSLAQTHSNLHLFCLDVTNYEEYEQFFNQVQNILGEQGLHVLVNNAGTYQRKSLDTLTVEDMQIDYNVNTIAVLKMTTCLLPFLKKWSQQNKGHRSFVVNMSSERGSLKLNEGGRYSYSASKAAQNMISKCLSHDLQQFEIDVIAMHPGQVATDMRGPTFDITVQESVQNMIKLIQDPTLQLNGKFVDYKGTSMPW